MHSKFNVNMFPCWNKAVLNHCKSKSSHDLACFNLHVSTSQLICLKLASLKVAGFHCGALLWQVSCESTVPTALLWSLAKSQGDLLKPSLLMHKVLGNPEAMPENEGGLEQQELVVLQPSVAEGVLPPMPCFSTTVHPQWALWNRVIEWPEKWVLLCKRRQELNRTESVWQEPGW